VILRLRVFYCRLILDIYGLAHKILPTVFAETKFTKHNTGYQEFHLAFFWHHIDFMPISIHNNSINICLINLTEIEIEIDKEVRQAKTARRTKRGRNHRE
jgi:hypothetical protein